MQVERIVTTKAEAEEQGVKNPPNVGGGTKTTRVFPICRTL